MLKRNKEKKHSRERSQRKALLQSVARALVEREKVRTTLAKAKAVSPLVDKLVTRAKKGDVAARREIARVLGQELGKKMMGTIVPSFEQRKGGYTRVIKLGKNKENSAEMAILEFVK